jgi:hypothetical protein
MFATPSIGQEKPRVEDSYPHRAKAQKYVGTGFQPIDCFAGQVTVRGTRVTREPFSVSLPDGNKQCCGTLVKSARTDAHGHFLAEPMREGEYFAQFQFKGVEHVVSFAIIDTYDRCGGSDYVQINFLEPSKAQIKESIWINDSGEECRANEPQCYRK